LQKKEVQAMEVREWRSRCRQVRLEKGGGGAVGAG